MAIVHVTQRAELDLHDLVAYYRQQSADATSRLELALDTTIASIPRSPHLGSLRYADLLTIPDIRCRRVGRFPMPTFYRSAASEVHVIRVLHEARDLGNLLEP